MDNAVIRALLRTGRVLLLGVVLSAAGSAGAEVPVPSVSDEGLITVSFRDTELNEVYEMLSRYSRTNILLGKGVEGSISLNLYDVTRDEAIRSVAEAAGYVVEKRGESFMILTREDAGKDSTQGNTVIRSLKVQYTDPQQVAELLEAHLSRYGKITTLADRDILVVEDLPEFVARVNDILAEVDVQPKQVLIEAKVLEITLTSEDTFGIDWSLSVSKNSAEAVFGTRGLDPGVPGLFVELMSSDLELTLSALSDKGRVRTLSTPKLLVLEHQEAEVLIGDRLGYRVTTTINQVTTESVEFIESGVILKVNAAVDRAGRVLLDIHPEVSTGTVEDGIPNVRTTEVTTQMLAKDGQQIFIGGLIRKQNSERRSGVPVLSNLPLMGGLFARTEELTLNTETVVMITPRVVNTNRHLVSKKYSKQVDATDQELDGHSAEVRRKLPSELDPWRKPPRKTPPEPSPEVQGTVLSWEPADGG